LERRARDDRGLIEVGEEHERVVVCLVTEQEFEQGRGMRSLLTQPALLAQAILRPSEEAAREGVEAAHLSYAGGRETAHGDRAVDGATGRIGVLPGQVIGGAGRDDLDVPARGHPLREQPAMTLGAADDLRSIAMDDEGHLRLGANPGGPPRTGRAQRVERLGKRAEGGLGRQLGGTNPSAFDEPPATDGIVEQDLAKRGDPLEALGAKEQAGVTHGFRYRAPVIGDDGNPRRHRLADRQAETFVLAHRYEQVRRAVGGTQLVLAHGTQKDDVILDRFGELL
jgi:hypothetical protein